MLTLLGLAVLAILAYLPAQTLPFISDDYLQLKLAREYGPAAGWSALAADPLYRCRATSLVLTYWTERLFGLDPLPFNLSSLLLHIANVWLVFALGYWRLAGWRLAGAAAAFFAFYQGHQEAVIWYAALPELLVFFFGISSLLFWLRYVQADEPSKLAYSGAAACFVLALLSKESGVMVPGLMALVVLVEGRERLGRLLGLIPFAAAVAVYFAVIYLNRSQHLHFNDAGSFSLAAPFLWVMLRSSVRLFWVWGFVSLGVLALWRERARLPLVGAALAWVAITLLPYCFLTYMPFVPSRHTYFASAGLSLVVAAGFLALRQRTAARPRAALALAALVFAHHCGYLWTKKQRQFAERAAPTEQLIEFASHVPGPIQLHCFPYPDEIAQLALELRFNGRREIVHSGAARAGVFCAHQHDKLARAFPEKMF